MIERRNMHFTRFLVIFVILMIIPSLIPLRVTGVETYSVHQRTIWFIAPAVKGDKGDLINVSITISPGKGNVRVEAGGEVSSSTITSTRLAFYVACTAAGVDWRDLDAIVKFHTSSSIEGPSASMGITIATYALLKGYNKGIRYVITGAISPDFSAVPIGGVSEKLNAAVQGNYTMVLPLSNIGDIPLKYRNDTIMVTGLFNASQEIGLEPFSIFSNISVEQRVPQEYTDLVWADTRTMLQLAYNNISAVPESFREQHEMMFRNTVNLFEIVNETISKGDIHPYSAASLAFRILSNATSLHEYYELINSPQYLNNVIRELNHSIYSLNKEILNLDEDYLWGFELKSVAASRLIDANNTYNTLLEICNNKSNIDYMELAKTIGYIKARLTSVSHWIKASIALNNYPPYLPKDAISMALDMYIDYAKTTLQYQLALISETNLPQNTKERIVNSINRDLHMIEKAQALRLRGENAFSFGLAMESMADALSRFTGMIDASLANSLYYMQGLKAYTRELSYTAKLLETRSLLAGFPSILTIDYIEYGNQLIKMNDLEAAQGITSYGVSSAIFWLLTSHSRVVAEPAEETASGEHGEPFSYIASLMIVAILVGISIGYITSIVSIRKEFLST